MSRFIYGYIQKGKYLSNVRWLLIVVLVVIQLLLPASTFASSHGSGFTFGTSQALDRASVSVVRLTATYNAIPSVSGCASSATGLGVLVGSWNTTPNTPADFTNWILSDGSFINANAIACGIGGKAKAQLSSIKIFVNIAFTSATSNPLIKSLNCQAGTCTDGKFAEALKCQIGSDCTSGVVLIPFHTSVPLPFIQIAQTAQSTIGPEPSGIELTGASLPSVAQITAVLTPSLASLSDPKNEFGMPIVDSNGQLLDMNLRQPSDPAGTIRSYVTTTLQPMQSNEVQSNWDTGVKAYYAKNYPAAQQALQNAERPNPQFKAPVTFLTLPAFISSSTSDKTKTPTAGHVRQPTSTAQSQSENSINVFGLQLPGSSLIWYILAGVLLLVIVLSLMLIRGRNMHREELARFEGEVQEASAKAIADTQHMDTQETPQIQQVPPQVRSTQDSVALFDVRSIKTIASSSPQAPFPVQMAESGVKVTPISNESNSLCPNCRQLIPIGAAFCANCGFSLISEPGAQTQASVPPATILQQLSKPTLPPVAPIPLQVAPRNERELRLEEANGGEMPSRVGEKFGHYKLARLLGEGGFAEVYLGEHIHLGSEAAIKVLHGQLTSKEREEFRREAITLAHLIHPHIVRLLDFGFEDKTPYLVMDYAPNGTLRQRHPKGTRIPPEVLLPYVRQIAYALQFAHDQRLVHRDIKPENMLVGRQQEIVLSDFGLAIVSQSSRSYNDKDKAGTATYMAPEQFEGKLHPASDQYALAIVVYEWLRGEPPFNVGNFIQLGYQHTYIAPPPLHESLPTIAPTAEQVVLRALTKDPAQRWPSVKAFAEALEQAM